MKFLVDLGEDPFWRKSRGLGLALRPFLEALTTADQIFLETHSVPPLYELHARGLMRYQEEPLDANGRPQVEHFDGIKRCIGRGWGDCDDLAPWRAAELRRQGERAQIRIQWRRVSSGKLFHIVIRRPHVSPSEFNPNFMKRMPNGSVIEDPSRALGMGSEQGRVGTSPARFFNQLDPL